jgi:hypothetical protein
MMVITNNVLIGMLSPTQPISSSRAFCCMCRCGWMTDRWLQISACGQTTSDTTTCVNYSAHIGIHWRNGQFMEFHDVIYSSESLGTPKAKRCTMSEAGSNKCHSKFLIDQQSNGLQSSNIVKLVLILVCKLFQPAFLWICFSLKKHYH